MRNRKNQIQITAITFCFFFLPFASIEHCKIKKEVITIPIQEERIKAPDFPESLDWVNTKKKIRMKDLLGKIVLLDFWTYCCINCIHVIPDLNRLEEKYKKELVVIGVHSAKFDTEKESSNILEAVRRYGIRHPVLNDNGFILWDKYQLRAWPSLILIDPDGAIYGKHTGEGVFELFDELISKLLNEYSKSNKIIKGEMSLIDAEKNTLFKTVLSYPGKLIADEKTDMLYISDSRHHRILGYSFKEHKTIFTVGSKQKGFQDGSFQNASFDNPQGLALSGDSIYIADTGNHAIRKISLKNKLVTTIIGTGKQGHSFSTGGDPFQTSLNSPWDLVIDKEHLYIAMAGSHQIWRYDLMQKQLEVFAGTGVENIYDGDSQNAAFSQPSGLAISGDTLYIADSEVSAVRSIHLPSRKVKTLIGKGLFEFGDRDGLFKHARLQHPIGITANNGMVYLADTYNHKIKVLDLSKGKIYSMAGSKIPGFKDGISAEFFEPSGITLYKNFLLLADTNNHSIRKFNLKDNQTSTLSIYEPEKIKFYENTESGDKKIFYIGRDALKITLSLQLGSEYRISDTAPTYLKLWKNDKIVRDIPKEFIKGLKVELPIQLIQNTDQLMLAGKIYYCNKKNTSLCFVEDIMVEMKMIKGKNVNYEMIFDIGKADKK